LAGGSRGTGSDQGPGGTDTISGGLVAILLNELLANSRALQAVPIVNGTWNETVALVTPVEGGVFALFRYTQSTKTPSPLVVGQ
jgi:hypothetical protein